MARERGHPLAEAGVAGQIDNILDPVRVFTEGKDQLATEAGIGPQDDAGVGPVGSDLCDERPKIVLDPGGWLLTRGAQTNQHGLIAAEHHDRQWHRLHLIWKSLIDRCLLDQLCQFCREKRFTPKRQGLRFTWT